MKRVILCASALLAGGFAFAQTPTPTPLTPSITVPSSFVGPSAQKAQTGAGATIGTNYSLIDQVDIGNKAKVVQLGTTNGSFIYQIGDNAANLNRADVLQSGNVPGGLSGESNYTEIMQDGEGNHMKSRQYGDDNDVRSNQLGNDNRSSIQQGSAVAQVGERNLGMVDQTGNDNQASIQQRYDDNKAQSTQLGDRNKSFQEQTSHGNQSQGQTAVSMQTGDDNQVRQFQTGPNDGSTGNYAEATQGDSSTDAVNAFAQQIQDGSNNRASITQNMNSDRAFQEQMGSDNVAVAEQNLSGISTGGDNFTSQLQNGDRNEAKSRQQGNNNKSWQEQVGDDNKSLTIQTYGQGVGNRAISLQNGSLNDSQISQQSFGNYAKVDQRGTGHISFVTQNVLGSSVGNALLSGQNSVSVTQRDSGQLAAPLQARTNPSVRSLSLNGSN